ncbi:MAG TPA: hypothetical protein VJ818_00125, partial [Actinomycetota bacterium]|nr:hypothetical protein [Actinomycetota bacterium]
MGGSLIRRPLGRAAVLIALAASMVSPAGAAQPATGTLSNARAIVRWTGHGSSPAGYTPPAYTPQLCATVQASGLCDVHSLTLNLPPNTFTKPDDGVFIDIRWSTDFDQWNLFVFDPAGNLVASGFDLDSNAQGLLIQHPANGVYSVVAVPFYQEPKMSYRGEARVFLDDTERYARPTTLLPRLWTAPPRDFHIECANVDPSTSETSGGCTDVPPLPSNPTGWRWGGAYTNSCYLEEQLQPIQDNPASGLANAPRRCLRFTNDIRNVGPGSLVLRIPMSAAISGTCEMQQVLRATNGAERLRDAGKCMFHPQHAHFHYLGLSSYAMYRAPAANATTPPVVRGAPVARGIKLGYCLIDVDLFANLAQPGSFWPRTYSFPTCNVPPGAPTSSSSPFEEMGISRGWGDVYT